MTSVYFTADQHFGHAGIIGLCKRPFRSVEEMDEAMIAAWNAVVGPDDDVWHLGDFAYRIKPGRLTWIFARLQGRKHVVPGNHDHDETFALPRSSPPRQIAEVTVEGRRIVLCHYAMRTWPGQHKGALHLYGHSHGKLPGTPQSTDVGVDCWGFQPIRLDQIRARLRKEGL
jgi:calcineurin-like phosphoesterase family protein